MKKDKGGGKGGAKKEWSTERGSDGICLGFNVECRNGHGFCW